jgi:hypothetical protein
VPSARGGNAVGSQELSEPEKSGAPTNSMYQP